MEVTLRDLEVARGGELVKGRDVVFMCYKGTERSRAIVRLLEDRAVKGVRHFDGGTKRFCSLSPGEVRKFANSDPLVLLVYEEGSKDYEHIAKQCAEDLMEQYNIEHQEIGTSDLVALGQKFGKNYYEFLTGE